MSLYKLEKIISLHRCNYLYVFLTIFIFYATKKRIEDSFYL